MIGAWILQRFFRRGVHCTSAAYYQHIHATDHQYQANNWLLSEVEIILSVGPTSILEIGCGNGRFLAEIKKRGLKVTGIDWARSPLLDELGVAENFQCCDLTRNDLPSADLVCSADVLEHIAPSALMATLRKIHMAGRYQYHVIACYDDNHSHMSIMSPKGWLRCFRIVSSEYRLAEVRLRDSRKPICVITNFPANDSA